MKLQTVLLPMLAVAASLTSVAANAQSHVVVNHVVVAPGHRVVVVTKRKVFKTRGYYRHLKNGKVIWVNGYKHS